YGGGGSLWLLVLLVMGHLLYQGPHQLPRALDYMGSYFIERRLAALLRGLLRAGAHGVSGLGNASADENWEFTSALFFAASVLTTTGYGHTVPVSDGGKIFCILYAAVGIPMTLVLLACLLQALMPVLSSRPVRYVQRRWGLPLAHVALGHALALGLATLALFILIPAICFWALEDHWNFLESVYFCFISLSTIGLGDYVPKGRSGPLLHELYELSITCKPPGGRTRLSGLGAQWVRGAFRGRDGLLSKSATSGSAMDPPWPPEGKPGLAPGAHGRAGCMPGGVLTEASLAAYSWGNGFPGEMCH
uniref:Potassium channel domain-containing protein n=1 Tax=Varanus komodoensis TaxID=61221 RepID=A0A8D2Q605_VARKO